MCYNRLPNLSDYWSSTSSMGNQFIKNAISRNRFQILMSKLYFNHPEKPDNATKLYYIEELVNCMKQTFSYAMSESSHQSTDESMVKFKGRSVLKQYLPLKSIKRGVKVWQRCDAQTGYIFDLNICAGKTENDEFSEGTLGERVVTKLCSTIKIYDVVLSFDRFFTSVNLLHTLPFPAVGTAIKSRKNVPKFKKHLEKGKSEFLATSSVVVPRMFYTIPGVVPPLCPGDVPRCVVPPPQVLCPAVHGCCAPTVLWSLHRCCAPLCYDPSSGVVPRCAQDVLHHITTEHIYEA